MKMTAFDEVPIQRDAGGSHFPLCFSWQPSPCPARIRIRFEITDVANRLIQSQRSKAPKGKVPPRAVLLLPIERRAPLLLIDRKPAEGQPKFWALVAAVLLERQVFLVRDEPGSQLKLV